MLGLLGGLFGGLNNMVNGIIQQHQHQEEMYQREQDRALQQKMFATQLDYINAGREWDNYMNERNIDAQWEINQANINNQRELNNIMRQREDTAVQRRAQDLRAAGINPLLAGIQGAAAAPGNIATMSAPVMDTSIGSRYAANIGTAYDTYGKNMREIAAEAGRSNERIARVQQNIVENINTITTSVFERKQLKAKTEETTQNTKLIQANILKNTADIELTQQKTISEKRSQEFIRETITTEPIKRALLKAQTFHENKQLEQITQNIKSMEEHQRSEIIQQAKDLAAIDLSKEQIKQVQAATTKLLLEGDMQAFENSIKDVTKGMEYSNTFVNMFCNVVKSLFFGKANIAQ